MTAWPGTGLRWLVPTLLSTMVTLGACTPASSDGATDDLTVFAAASLRDVFRELERAWEAERPGSDLTIAYDGSNVLAAQIREGAPADVFASADLVRPRQLLETGDASGDLRAFARNRLALVVPRDGDAVRTAVDLALPGVRIVAAGPGVPVTAYAEEAIAQLARTTPDAATFAAAVAANTVSREDNVRAALAKVELGEGDAAIVYHTDAASSDGVRELPLPADVDVTAEYGAVVTSDRAVATDFLDWLSGPTASQLLTEAGFEGGS